MTIANQEVKTSVFVLNSNFDVVINGQKAIRLFVLNNVVFDRQKDRRLFVLNIGFLQIHYREIIGVCG